MKYKVAQIPSVGMMVIEDENGILLSHAEVAGLLNSLEQRLAEAETKNKELEATVKSYMDNLVDRLMEYKAVSDE